MIVLFAIGSSGLDMDSNDALYYYGLFTMLVYVVPLLTGLITDFSIKQKNAVILGGVLSLIGYLLITTGQMTAVALGLLLIAFGTGFVNPNLTVLLGRFYDKSERNRDFGFIFYYLMINVGAFT